VALEVAHRGAHRPTLNLLGRVESPHTARLTSAVAAYVETLHVREGERVDAGGLLIALEDTDYRLNLEQNEAELADIEAQLRLEALQHAADRKALAEEEALLALSRRGVKRAEDLKARNVGTEAGVDQALQDQNQRELNLVQRRLAIAGHEARKARLLAQRARIAARLEQNRLDLERTRIRAPFNGRVTATLVAPGDRVRAGDELAEIFDTDRIEIRAQVPARYQADLTRAMTADLALPAAATLGTERFPVRFSRLAARVEQGSGGLDALFEVPARTPWLPVGQTVAVDLALPPEPDTFLLPRDALYGSDRVYRVVDGRLEAVTVAWRGDRRGEGGDHLVVVESTALNDGDRVVTTQLPNAVTGLRVRAVDDHDAGNGTDS
jgi:RND family efflux transporter MFP subunit